MYRLQDIESRSELPDELVVSSDLSNLPNSSAIALTKRTIMQAHIEREAKPEVQDAELLFCITTDS